MFAVFSNFSYVMILLVSVAYRYRNPGTDFADIALLCSILPVCKQYSQIYSHDYMF